MTLYEGTLLHFPQHSFQKQPVVFCRNAPVPRRAGQKRFNHGPSPTIDDEPLLRMKTSDPMKTYCLA